MLHVVPLNPRGTWPTVREPNVLRSCHRGRSPMRPAWRPAVAWPPSIRARQIQPTQASVVPIMPALALRRAWAAIRGAARPIAWPSAAARPAPSAPLAQRVRQPRPSRQANTCALMASTRRNSRRKSSSAPPPPARPDHSASVWRVERDAARTACTAAALAPPATGPRAPVPMLPQGHLPAWRPRAGPSASPAGLPPGAARPPGRPTRRPRPARHRTGSG